jgi:hypothetical protein
MKDLFLSLRSRREHKAWGVSPREAVVLVGARVSGRQTREQRLSAVVTGCNRFDKVPGARAPGFMLTPASQARTSIELDHCSELNNP